MSDALPWLRRWFASRHPAAADAPDDTPYFEAGWIDSMGVIDLIEACEAEFAIRFAPEHFQDRRFSILSGLAAIIAGLRR